jgi:hypothetical protein
VQLEEAIGRFTRKQRPASPGPDGLAALPGLASANQCPECAVGIMHQDIMRNDMAGETVQTPRNMGDKNGKEKQGATQGTLQGTLFVAGTERCCCAESK